MPQESFLTVVILVAGVFGLMLLLFLVQAVSIFRLWLQALLTNADVSVLTIVGMKLRRINPREVVAAHIMSVQAGDPVPVGSIERAAHRNLDVEKVTLAYLEAHKSDPAVSYEQICDAEQHGRLRSMLQEDERTFR